jgi:hypothetical protein
MATFLNPLFSIKKDVSCRANSSTTNHPSTQYEIGKTLFLLFGPNCTRERFKDILEEEVNHYYTAACHKSGSYQANNQRFQPYFFKRTEDRI